VEPGRAVEVVLRRGAVPGRVVKTPFVPTGSAPAAATASPSRPAAGRDAG